MNQRVSTSLNRIVADNLEIKRDLPWLVEV